jgi:NTP pyrophosphatase (non-canonical NTP hydrolase)
MSNDNSHPDFLDTTVPQQGLDAASKLDLYRQMVENRESPVKMITDAVQVEQIARVLHAILGICSEGGELAEMIKKHLAYGKEFDHANFLEELGDVMWYIQLAANVMGYTILDIMQANNDKLAIRYGGPVWNQDKALNRDLEQERKSLESNARTGS